jgi:hypothetical protein
MGLDEDMTTVFFFRWLEPAVYERYLYIRLVYSKENGGSATHPYGYEKGDDGKYGDDGRY